MKIKEVSDRTGLSRRTIRFYEEKGLFSPKKEYVNGKEFREYSEEDVSRLTSIALLRKARFSVDEIRRMKEAPEDIPEIFEAYRMWLRSEYEDLGRILQVTDSIEAATFESPDQLADALKSAAEQMPLPAVDVHPRFRYLDEMEERYARKKRSRMTEQERRQHQIAAQGAVMYAAVSVQNNSGNNMAAGGKGGGFDVSNAQKIAAYNLLVNSRDEE